MRETLRVKDNHDRIISAVNAIKLVRKKIRRRMQGRKRNQRERERGRRRKEIKEKSNHIIIL